MAQPPLLPFGHLCWMYGDGNVRVWCGYRRCCFTEGTPRALTPLSPSTHPLLPRVLSRWYENKANNPFPQKTIFDSFADAGLTWKNYYDDTPWELFLATLQKETNKQYLQNMSHFHVRGYCPECLAQAVRARACVCV